MCDCLLHCNSNQLAFSFAFSFSQLNSLITLHRTMSKSGGHSYCTGLSGYNKEREREKAKLFAFCLTFNSFKNCQCMLECEKVKAKVMQMQQRQCERNACLAIPSLIKSTFSTHCSIKEQRKCVFIVWLMFCILSLIKFYVSLF